MIVATTSTTPVTNAPTPFSVARQCQPSPRTRNHRRTIPVWDRVNAVKTPITYSWISRVSSAS